MFLNSVTRNLIRRVPFARCFSTVNVLSKSSFYKYPVRLVHQRGYNDFYDTWSFRFHEINFALGGCKNTDNFIFVFKKYG